MRNKLQFQIIQGELSNLSQITLLQRNNKALNDGIQILI